MFSSQKSRALSRVARARPSASSRISLDRETRQECVFSTQSQVAAARVVRASRRRAAAAGAGARQRPAPTRRRARAARNTHTHRRRTKESRAHTHIPHTLACAREKKSPSQKSASMAQAALGCAACQKKQATFIWPSAARTRVCRRSGRGRGRDGRHSARLRRSLRSSALRSVLCATRPTRRRPSAATSSARRAPRAGRKSASRWAPRAAQVASRPRHPRQIPRLFRGRGGGGSINTLTEENTQNAYILLSRRLRRRAHDLPHVPRTFATLLSRHAHRHLTTRPREPSLRARRSTSAPIARPWGNRKNTIEKY